MSSKLPFLLGIILILMLAITPSNIQAVCVTNDSIGGQAADFMISSEQAAINSHLLNSTDMIKLKANIADLTKTCAINVPEKVCLWMLLARMTLIVSYD